LFIAKKIEVKNDSFFYSAMLQLYFLATGIKDCGGGRKFFKRKYYLGLQKSKRGGDFVLKTAGKRSAAK